jgi:hypothetical protein
VSDVVSDSVDEELFAQGAGCAAYGSPMYGVMMKAAARDYRDRGPVRSFFNAEPRRRTASRIGLRLMGALHLRALDGSAPALAAHLPSTGGDGDAAAAWREARRIIADEGETLSEAFDRTPQTNEAARSMPLLGGLLAIADEVGMPVALLDVGASAGLNLRLDRFRYEGPDWAWGDAASALVLRNRTLSGRPNHLDAQLHVAERLGCDLHPLDVSNERECLELRSYVWPDQIERFARLDAAIAVARNLPVTIDRADFLQWIPQRAVPRENAATVVMHSIVTQHLSNAVRDGMQRAIEEACSLATASSPMAWLRLEEYDASYQTRLTIWPSRREYTIARSDGHGQSIEWCGA